MHKNSKKSGDNDGKYQGPRCLMLIKSSPIESDTCVQNLRAGAEEN